MSSLLADELLASGFLEAGTISLPEIVYGADGTGIYSCNWDDSGHLTITLTDGRVFVSPSLTGPRGLTGARGEPGEKGDTGEKGDPGPEGAQGIRGLTGPIGPKGDKGDKGDIGEQGPAGPRGERGPQGIDGSDGFSPTVAVSNITGGHRVTITDATHPSGQSFDVLDGQGEMFVVDIRYKHVPGSGGFDPGTFRWEFSASANEIADAVTRGKKIVGHLFSSLMSDSLDFSELLFAGVDRPVNALRATFSEVTSTGITIYYVRGNGKIATVETIPFSGGGISSLLVTFSESNGVWTADKTFAEVTAAIADGAYVYATDTRNIYYALSECDPRPNDGAVTFISAGSPNGGYMLYYNEAVNEHSSSFATQAWVQNRYQSKTIIDTGGYYTTDTVQGALQEIGAELAGINTLIGSGVIT